MNLVPLFVFYDTEHTNFRHCTFTVELQFFRESRSLHCLKKKEIGICILYDVYKLLPSCQRQEYFRLDTQVTIHCLFCNMNAPYSHYKNVLIWLDNYVWNRIFLFYSSKMISQCLNINEYISICMLSAHHCYTKDKLKIVYIL